MSKPAKAWGEPLYFAVQKTATIDVAKFDLPKTYGHLVYVISFSAMHLECPGSEPIAVYHYAGTRRFMWMDRLWTEVDIDYRGLFKKITTDYILSDSVGTDKNLNVLLGLLQLYHSSDAPISNLDNRIFCRAMCRIYD